MVRQATTELSQALTPRQQAVLGLVVEYVARHGYSPTIRDIQREAGISSTSVVDYTLDALQAAGYLQRTPGTSRSIVLLPLAHLVWQ